MLDRESILRRGGELELECPNLGSDLMGKNGESKLSYYKHGSVGVRSDAGEYASARHFTSPPSNRVFNIKADSLLPGCKAAD